MIDWTKPLVVAGTDRVATVVSTDYAECTRTCFADWDGNGEGYLRKLGFDTPRLTNAPPTPKIGPEHIEALTEMIAGPEAWLDSWAQHVGNCKGGYVCTCGLVLARTELSQARAYLESL